MALTWTEPYSKYETYDEKIASLKVTMDVPIVNHQLKIKEWLDSQWITLS